MSLSDDVRELLRLYDWQDVRGAFKPARFLPVPDEPPRLRPEGKLVFRSELPDRLLRAYDVAISEGLVEQYLLEPENQLPLYKSMGWPAGMPEVKQDRPWPLVPDWSDAMVVITPKARGVLAENPKRLNVDFDRMEITLDGRTFPCRSEQALLMLQVYAERPGQWFTAKQVASCTKPPVESGKVCVLKKKLPPEIRDLIEGDTHHGSRIVLPPL